MKRKLPESKLRPSKSAEEHARTVPERNEREMAEGAHPARGYRRHPIGKQAGHAGLLNGEVGSRRGWGK